MAHEEEAVKIPGTKRISGLDTFREAIVKMVEGNPGALRVLVDFAKRHVRTREMEVVQAIVRLDTLGIYGSRIWMLWKDVCGEEEWRFDETLLGNRISEEIDLKKASDPHFAAEWEYYERREE